MATKFAYTESEVQEIVAKYKSGTGLEVLATQYNKSVASIRMKLVKLGAYTAQKPAGGTKTKKQEIKEAQEIIDRALELYGEPPF